MTSQQPGIELEFKTNTFLVFETNQNRAIYTHGTGVSEQGVW